MKPAISVTNFSKNFGYKQVIHDLSFEVEQGEIFAFLGANGSGKTTTLRTLLGIYQPDKGELLVNGEKYSSSHSQILGYLPEERGLYLDSLVLDTLVYFGQIKGLDAQTAKQRATEYLERVGLADKAKSKIKKLSSGQQQKIQLGITIINRPSLLVLDEPTKGLDPVNRLLLLDILKELNSAGSSIIFSTHQMEEAEKIAHRLLMIKDGRSALYGKVDEVKSQFGENRVKLKFSGRLVPAKGLFAIDSQSTNYAELTPTKKATSQQILTYLVESGIQIYHFEMASPSLNEIFIEVSQGRI
ncbi:MAG: ATP-binding cassette domain-containing protein [Candidatus Doudnabacteria bacterium]|nr:ATP-binding cassette domain-containing protein [Candidatus Doudnabacteria bacterium]